MIWWLGMLGWFAMSCFTAVHVARVLLEGEARRRLRGRERRVAGYTEEVAREILAAEGPLITPDDRASNLGFALAFSVAWPACWVFIGFNTLVGSAAWLETPTEKAERDRQELIELRALAREHGLSMPEVKR
jgi:hypothetical protein